MDTTEQLVVVGRLALALVVGAVIGWERELQREQAGLKTYSLVSLGAALFTVLSTLAFPAGDADPPGSWRRS